MGQSGAVSTYPIQVVWEPEAPPVPPWPETPPVPPRQVPPVPPCPEIPPVPLVLVPPVPGWPAAEPAEPELPAEVPVGAETSPPQESAINATTVATPPSNERNLSVHTIFFARAETERTVTCVPAFDFASSSVSLGDQSEMKAEVRRVTPGISTNNFACKRSFRDRFQQTWRRSEPDDNPRT